VQHAVARLDSIETGVAWFSETAHAGIEPLHQHRSGKRIAVSQAFTRSSSAAFWATATQSSEPASEAEHDADARRNLLQLTDKLAAVQQRAVAAVRSSVGGGAGAETDAALVSALADAAAAKRAAEDMARLQEALVCALSE
jgi:hypothetical protein